MIPLRTNRRVLTWLSIFPAEENCTKKKKWAYVVFSSSVFFVNVFAATASAWFFSEQKSVSLEDALFALIQTIGLMNVTYINVITFHLRHIIVSLLLQLTEYYRAHQNDGLIRYLEQANRTSEKIWKVFLTLLAAGLTVATLIPIVSVLMSYLKDGSFYSEYLYKPYKMVLPWNQHTLLGYVLETIVTIVGSITFVISTTFIILFISLCLHQLAFFQMFSRMLNALEYPDQKNHHAIQLRQMIQFHCSIKDFFNKSAECFSLFLFVQLMSTMMMASGCIFQFELTAKNTDASAGLVIVIFSNCILSLFLYCYIGKMASESYQNISDALFHANWINLQAKYQKSFIMMIANSQQPLYYHGFGLIVLDLVTFTNLLKRISSYYMAFKAVTATG